MSFTPRFLSAALLCFGLLIAPQTQAQTSQWKIDPTHSSVEFQIRHLSVSNVRGNFSKLAGTITLDEKDISKSSVEAMIDATTVNTNEAKRDEHLRGPEFFDVAKYPALTFKSTAITSDGHGKLTLVGDLTMGGQTKPVTLALDGPSAPQKGPGGKTLSGFSATGSLSRKNFNFGQKYGSMVLGDEIKFTIDIEMEKE